MCPGESQPYSVQTVFLLVFPLALQQVPVQRGLGSPPQMPPGKSISIPWRKRRVWNLDFMRHVCLHHPRETRLALVATCQVRGEDRGWDQSADLELGAHGREWREGTGVHCRENTLDAKV